MFDDRRTQARQLASTSRCTATPRMTSPTPSASSALGSWARTTTPITAATAGSSATISAYVERAIRAIASWSVTYGITDEDTPTPMPAAIATGSVNAGTAAQAPIGVATT